MASKYVYIAKLYDSISKEVARSPEDWKAFLETASNNYKLRFDENLLVYAQKPEATAVLEIEKWNGRFHRWVNRGAKGIAVFYDSPDGKASLKHYFDIADTHEGKNPVPVPIWKMKNAYKDEVISALEGVFGELERKDSLKEAIISAAENGAEDNFTEYLEALKACRQGSFLDDLDEDNLSAVFRETVAESVAYMMGSRLEASKDMAEEMMFSWISQFNTKDSLNALGYATVDIAAMGLREIAKTVLMLEKEDRTFGAVKQSEYNEEKERSEKDGDHLYDDKRGSDTGYKGAGDRRNGTRSLGNEKEGLSSEGEADRILQSSDVVQVERTSAADRARSGRDDANAYRSDESEGEDQRRTEGEISDAVDTGDEQYQTESKGDRTEGTHIQLAYFDRGAEDRSLPFFHIDKVAEAVRSFFDENTLQEIELFYKENSDEGSRISFLKEKFSGLPEKEALGYGCKLYSNVLFLYEGEQGIPQSGAYYDWRVIEECLEGLMLTGAFYSEIDPRSFTFSQEIIDIALTSGSLYENGKFRIYEQFQKSLSEQENIAFLKQEYGIGGRSDIK